MLKPEELIGHWTLVSHKLRKKDGTYQDSGPDPKGSIRYSRDGQMSVSINWKLKDSENIPAQDVLNSILFYSGRWSISEDGLKVVHHIEHSSQLWRIGKSLERLVNIEGDLLTLEGDTARGWGRICYKRIQTS